LATGKIWLLKLVPPFRHGGWLTGLLLLSLLLPLFYLGVEESPVRKTPALFFSFIIAYIIPVFSFITVKSQEALNELRPILDLDDRAFNQAQARLESASPRLTGLSLGAGTLSGCIHISFFRGSPAAAVREMLTSVSGFVAALGTVMVWIVMTTVVVMLIRQTVLFGRLGGRHVRISLLDTRKLLPFARVSIISSLAVIGALALFPLIGFETGLNLAESLPGAIALLAPLITMFIIPVWPVHRRMATMKERELASLSDRIGVCLDAAGGADLDSESLDKLSPLLNYRREIAEVSSWPFDLGNMTTFAFYLIIPPLAWVGAALIERLVDRLI